MHQSLIHTSRTLVIAMTAGIAAITVNLPAHADIAARHEPGFLRHAARELRQGNPENALRIIAARNLEQFKTRHRAEAEGINCRAQLELEALEAARKSCATALTLDRSRSNWRFYNNLGVAELKLGNVSEAEEAFSTAAARSGYASAPRRNLRLVDALRDADRAGAAESLAAEVR